MSTDFMILLILIGIGYFSLATYSLYYNYTGADTEFNKKLMIFQMTVGHMIPIMYFLYGFPPAAIPFVVVFIINFISLYNGYGLCENCDRYYGLSMGNGWKYYCFVCKYSTF